MCGTRLPIAAALIAVLNTAPATVAATTLTVSNCNDAGSGSLRAVLGAAGNNDVVDMTQLVCSKITLTKASGPLQTAASASNVTLNGPTSRVLTIDGASQGRVLLHLGSGTLALNDLTVVNGKYTTGSGTTQNGGCIDASNGSVALTRSHLTSCIAQSPGHGGCVHVLNHVTLANSTLDHCAGGAEAAFGDTVDLQDSAITNSAGGIGAYNATLSNSSVANSTYDGITASGYLKLQDSFVSGNGGAGIQLTGTYYCDEYYNCSTIPANARMDSSIISGNAKGGVIDGGDVAVYGSFIEHNRGKGGFFGGATLQLTDTFVNGNAAQSSSVADSSTGGITAGALTATRSTISGNTGYDAGGVLANTVTLVNTTISANRASMGTQPTGGLKVRGAVTAYNSTIVFNSGDVVGGVNASTGKIASCIIGGNNNTFAGDDRNLELRFFSTFANNIIASSNIVTGANPADPKLTPLAGHGGLVPTHALPATSPALDTGLNPTSLTTDIRGTGFARVVGAGTDVGAYERQADEDEIFGAGMEVW